MNDEDFLRSLGRVAREERAREDAEIEANPSLSRPLDDLELERIVQKLPVKKKPAKRVPAWVGPLAATLAIAAGVFFYVSRPTHSLPPYELTVIAGDREVRSGDAPAPEVRKLTPDSKFDLVFRPKTAVANVSARGFLVQNGVAKQWAVRPQTSDDGAVRYSGIARELFAGMTGDVGVLVVVGQGTISLSEADAATIYASGKTDLTIARVQVQLVP